MTCTIAFQKQFTVYSKSETLTSLALAWHKRHAQPNPCSAHQPPATPRVLTYTA